MKHLYRSTSDRMMLGVCGGLAKYFDVDSTLIRVIWIIGSVVTGIVPGTLAYVVVGLVVPNTAPSS